MNVIELTCQKCGYKWEEDVDEYDFERCIPIESDCPECGFNNLYEF